MLSRRQLFILFTTFFFLLGVKAQDRYRAVHYGIDEGLGKERWHTGILKDVNGFVWFGSSYGEFSRFDGFNFQQYYPDKNKTGSIRSNNCLSFVEDSLHNIWIGTNKGLSRYDIKADTFLNFKTINQAPNAEEFVVPFWASSKEIFCIENGSSISSYNVDSFKRKKLLSISDLVQTGKVLIGPASNCSIFDSTSNSVWMLPANKEGLVQLSLITGKITYHYRAEYKKSQSSFHHNDAEAMCYDRRRNCIWINSHDGLVQFTLSDKQFHHIDALNPLVNLKEYDRFVGIDVDPKGRIWLATMPKGIIVFDPSSQSVIEPMSDTSMQKEVAEGNVKIYCDRDGIVWTSYWSANGIFQLIPFTPTVRRYTANENKTDSLSSLNIQNMVPGGHGSLWIGTWDKGLNIFNPETGSFKVLREKDITGIKGKGIAPMFIDTLRKKAWLNAGPPDMVYEMDIPTQRCKVVVFKDTANRNLSPVNIINNTARPYKHGFLFLDAGYGIFEVTGEDQVARLVIPASFIARMTIAEDKRLFQAPARITYENIDGKWMKIPHPMDSIPWSDIYFDKTDQTYWVGANRELIHFDKNFHKIRSYTDEEGLIGEPLTIIPDGRGNIWFNNDRKIIGILNIKTGTVTSLSEQDGYKKQSYDWTSPQAKKAGGDLYFPGNPLALGIGIGLDRISPDKFAHSSPSLVYIKSLEINQKSFPLSTGVNNLKELSLRYFENKISIETGNIDFYSKGKSHIRYKLEAEGKNATWEYAPSYYTIRYEELPPGKYKLVMQASNAANDFIGPQKILSIIINPPFWATWWFRTIGVLAFIAIIYGFIQYRSRSLKQMNILLEKKVTARTNELNNSLAELKNTQNQLIHSEKMASLGELTSGIAHEIKNPLNFINNFSEINMDLIAELEEQPDKDAESEQIIKTLKKNSEKINHHGKRVDDIVKSMLQHSRVGNMTKEPVNINALCEESLKLAYHGFKAKEKTFNAAFEMHFDPDLPKVMAIPQDIGRVLLNVINNAFYAVHEKKKAGLVVSADISEPEFSYKPTVAVSTKRIENKILITVSDNGPGIPQKIINKIFQPFFTTKPTGEGTGLGLSMSYDIVTKSHGGELHVKSTEGEGTDFEILIPIK